MGRDLGQTWKVGAGLASQAVTTYLTLILIGRVVGTAQFASLASLYVLLTTVATGLFQPLEQEIARRLGRRRETGGRDAALLRRSVGFGGVLCLAVFALALLPWQAAVGLVGGEPQLLAAFFVALPGYVMCFVSRGALSGAGRLGRYGLQLAIEGWFRLLAAGVLAVLRVDSVSAYGWLFALAPWVALIPVGRAPSRAGGGHAEPLARPLLLLLGSSVAAQLLVGAGPIVAQLLSDDQARVGAFLAALVVVRVPVVVFAAIQSGMLPALAAHIAAKRRAEVVRLLSKVLTGMGVLAVLTSLCITAVGPWGLRLLFGPGYRLEHTVFLTLGVSTGLFLMSAVLGQAVLAAGWHRSYALAWLAGPVGLAAGVMPDGDPIQRTVFGLFVGSASVTLGLLLVLRRVLRAMPLSTASAPIRPWTQQEARSASPH